MRPRGRNMKSETRITSFLDVFKYGLLLHQQKQTQETLGNRSSYVGISDLARYGECPRAVILQKLNEVIKPLDRILTLQRGHWFECGVSSGFASIGLKHLRQLEISYKYQNVPIRGHLDVTLVWTSPFPAVRIVEVKSMDQLPKMPYESHEWQIKAQTGLLKQFWSKPVFRLSCNDGNLDQKAMTFPEVCSKFLGLEVPRSAEDCSIEGWLLCLSMKDASAYGPYMSDADFMENLNIQAVTFWKQLERCAHKELSFNDVPHAEGFDPLCGVCEFNGDCPKFSGEICQSQWEDSLERLDALKLDRSNLDAEIREIEKVLKQAHALSGLKDWINTGAHRFRLINAKGRLTLDRSLLHDELDALFCNKGIEGIEVDAFISRCEREGAPSSRLSVQSVNKDKL